MKYCYFHRGDLDGLCSGAIIKYVNPDCEMIGVEYGETPSFDHLTKEDIVFVVDFVFEPFNRMVELSEKVGTLYWFDHHKSSHEYFAKTSLTFSGVLGDNTKSACELVWEFFFPQKKASWALRALSLFDTWQFAKSEKEEKEKILSFQYGARAILVNILPIGMWEEFVFFPSDSVVNQIITEGEVIQRYQKIEYKKQAINCAYTIKLDDWNVLCMNAYGGGSAMFDSVFDPEKHDFVLCFAWFGNKYWKVSMYNPLPERNPNLDVSGIAKRFNGGGHKGAAGFEIHSETFPFFK